MYQNSESNENSSSKIDQWCKPNAEPSLLELCWGAAHWCWKSRCPKGGGVWSLITSCQSEFFNKFCIFILPHPPLSQFLTLFLHNNLHYLCMREPIPLKRSLTYCHPNFFSKTVPPKICSYVLMSKIHQAQPPITIPNPRFTQKKTRTTRAEQEKQEIL